MKITFLGTGTCHQQPDRSTTAIDCSGWGTHFLIDIGSGALRRMREAEIDPMTVEALFLTHVHPDHIADLVPLIQLYSGNIPKPRGRTLHIFGPKGMEAAVWGLIHTMMPNDYDSIPFKINVHEVRNSTIEFGDISIMAREVEHSGKGLISLGYRFDYRGKSFAYTGDTGMCSALESLSQKTDLLISGSTYPNAMADKTHLTPAEVALLGNKMKAKEIIMTHISPYCDDVDLVKEGSAFVGDISVAEDLIEVRV